MKTRDARLPNDETAEIDAALAHPLAPVPSTLQAAFNDFQLRNYRPSLLVVNLLAQLAYFVYGFADMLVAPDIGMLSIATRSLYLGVTLPLTLLVFRRASQMSTIDILLPLEILFATVIWFLLLAQSGAGGVSTYKYASVVFIVLANLCVQHRFLPALATSLLIAAATLAGVSVLEHANDGEFTIFCLAYFPILFFSLFSSWSTTLNRRRGFLRELREQRLRQQYTRFTAMVSHEFRNPLGVIDSQLALLRRESAQLQAEPERRIDIIAKSSRRLALLFDRWLQHDQTEYRLNRIEPEDILLQAWLEAVVREAEPLLHGHRVVVRVAADATRLVSDKVLLETALGNLLDNAAKYSPPGSTIMVFTHRDERAIGISVTDHGIGIPASKTTQIFEAYQRLQPESGPGGLGLGLALTRQILNALGGQVEVSSMPAEGSRFTLWLPAPAEPSVTNTYRPD